MSTSELFLQMRLQQLQNWLANGHITQTQYDEFVQLMQEGI